MGAIVGNQTANQTTKHLKKGNKKKITGSGAVELQS
jgi:hypothetical protein